MSRPTIDEVSNTYGNLTVLNRVTNQGLHATWLCLCTCGTTAVVTGSGLRSGNRTSCGCANKTIKHNLSKHRLYSVYTSAVDRCTNPLHPAYANYGGRGISMKFYSLEHFIEILYPSFKEGLSLERIN